MTLWRVLDLYQRAASRRSQAPAKQLTYLGNFTPKKSFAKNNTNSNLFSEFVLFAYGGHLFDKFEQTAEKETRCNESGVSSGGYRRSPIRKIKENFNFIFVHNNFIDEQVK